MDFKRLTSEEKQFYLARLEIILASKKSFLKSNFTLPDLARETGIQYHALSYIINSGTNSNFNDYLNLMRIEYFKEKINDSKWRDLTIREKAFASGFSCRTTCYRAFIKHTGMPPSKFIKQHEDTIILSENEKLEI